MRHAAKDLRPIPVPLAVLLVIAGIAILCLAAEPLLGIPLRIQRNYNEGWVALFAERAVTGGLLYPPEGAFIANNYPPLSFYLVGLLGNLTGDDVVAARWLALAGFLTMAASIGLAVGAMTPGRRWAALATTIFMLYGVTLFQGYLAMADPQWLAHGLAAPALVLLLRRPDGKPPARDIAIACLLLLASGLIKHNLLALPVAVTLWLAWHHRRGLVVWLATSAVGGAAILAVLHVLYGEAVFSGVLGHARAMRLANLVWVPWELRALLPLCCLAPLALLRWNSPPVRLVVLFAAVAGFWGLFQRLGDGVTYNAQFEMTIALCIAAGVGLAEVAGRVRWRLPVALVAGAALAVLCLPLILLTARMLAETPGRLARLDTQAARWEMMIADMADRVGPAACERLAVCYWAGKGFELDFFNYGQRLLTGRTGPRAFEALMRERSLRQILVPAAYLDGGGGVLPPAPVAALMRYYQPNPAALDGYVLLLPRP